MSLAIGISAQAGDLQLKTHRLGVSLNKTGRITSIQDVEKKTDYLKEAVPLVQCFLYGEGEDAQHLRKAKRLLPISMKSLSAKDGSSTLTLDFGQGIVFTVAVRSNKDYIRFELLDATKVNEISHIIWGPFFLNMQGPVGEYVGIARSDDFFVGVRSLEMNTTGLPGGHSFAAGYTATGSHLQLHSYDHTRKRLHRKEFVYSEVIPEETVIGSKFTLFGGTRGRTPELDAIEKVVLAEGLPYLKYQGKWNKRSREAQKPCLWTYIQESNAGEIIDMAKSIGAGTICRFHGYFKNWGHFELNENLWPGGIETYKRYSNLALKDKIGMTSYTLTGFIKPMPKPEPYIFPVVDSRFQRHEISTTLLEELSKISKTVRLADDKRLNQYLASFKQEKILQLGNELIAFKDFKKIKGGVELTGIKRGEFLTAPTTHAKNSVPVFLLLSHFRNLFPGTQEMNLEVADNIAKISKDSGNRKIILDGFESCLETGNGTYSKNRFLTHLNNHFKDTDMIFTGSNFDHYNWTMMAYLSWGEFDKHRGFRGTMLEYRLFRQLQLLNNNIANKMGQYYPDNATIEDINWLMGLTCGWESGVDLSVGRNFMKNPQFKDICETIRLWEEARIKEVFTEEEKMSLRQTDRIHELSKAADGQFELKFIKRWQKPDVKINPSSAIKLRAIKGMTIKPCSIDLSWTHNPLIYASATLSNDLIHQTGRQLSSFEIDIPSGPHGAQPGMDTGQGPIIVLRLPADAPCAIRNPKLVFNGRLTVEIRTLLKPGEYIAVPHQIARAYVYDSMHKLLSEADILRRLTLGSLERGKTTKVTVSVQPVVRGAKPQVIINMMCNYPIVSKK